MPSIIAIGTSIPDFIATNEYVVSLAMELSYRTYAGNVSELEDNIRSFLGRTGAKQCRWRSGLTKPFEHIAEAWQNCLTRVGSDASRKIGTLIYCGIDRGLAEPSHASLLAHKFGLRDVRTFDISDACMGWFTATQVASKVSTEDKPYCAIVSAEFPLEMPGRIYPQAFSIRNADDLLWKGAALTLGEAASVTVTDTTTPTPSTFKSDSRFADVCCVPLLRADRFVDSVRLLPRLGRVLINRGW